jgi:hypothetical protein
MGDLYYRVFREIGGSRGMGGGRTDEEGIKKKNKMLDGKGEGVGIYNGGGGREQG